MAAWRELLDAAFANLEELARLAADYAGVQDDPARLAEVERRRDLLFRLKKHGADSRPCSRPARPPRSWTCWTPPTSTSGRSPRDGRPPKARCAAAAERSRARRTRRRTGWRAP